MRGSAPLKRGSARDRAAIKANDAASAAVSSTTTSSKNTQKWTYIVWFMIAFAVLSGLKDFSNIQSLEDPPATAPQVSFSEVDEVEDRGIDPDPSFRDEIDDVIDDDGKDDSLINAKNDKAANLRQQIIEEEPELKESSEPSRSTHVSNESDVEEDDEPVKPIIKTVKTSSSSSKSKVIIDETRERRNHEEEEDEDFDIPFEVSPVYRNGCPFGWHSPSIESPYCYHVSLVPLTSDEANGRCAELGSVYGMRAYLARVPASDVNVLLCDVLNRGNNRFYNPDRLHIGLYDAASYPLAHTNGTLIWRDAQPFHPDHDFSNFRSTIPVKPGALSGRTVALECNEKQYLKWNVETDAALPFACSGPKLKWKFEEDQIHDRRELDDDSFIYEQSDSETITWATVAPWTKSTLDSCSKLAQEEEEIGSHRRAHKNAMLSRLEPQIFWKLTDHRSKLEPKRYYMIWQSKSWFGWLDFWVDYLAKYRDFRGAPVGKYVTSSRAAKERLGYSSIFGNPDLTLKYGGALVVLSRLPIPDNVVSYFPPGTLVNQLYMDPLARVPLGDKLELAQYLTKYAQSLGCNHVGDLEIIPPTFDASEEFGCKQALRAMEGVEDKSEVQWVIKGPKHGGSAINLATSSEVTERLGKCDEEVLDRHELVQKLIKDPLLLDGRKFDVRVFVLVASAKPFIAYIHREPYYRATIKKFSGGDGSEQQKSRHVTNTHIQKVTRTNFTDRDWADHLWTPDRVKLYASRAKLRLDFWDQVVFPKIKRAVQHVFKATTVSVRDRRPGQWKLFGVDFVIDHNLQPYLLDWNAFPGWDWSYRLSWTLEYRRRILGDTWRLLLDIQRGKAIAESRSTPKSGGYELIYHTLK